MTSDYPYIGNERGTDSRYGKLLPAITNCLFCDHPRSPIVIEFRGGVPFEVVHCPGCGNTTRVLLSKYAGRSDEYHRT
jgi:transcription elongation factor Elf1